MLPSKFGAVYRVTSHTRDVDE